MNNLSPGAAPAGAVLANPPPLSPETMRRLAEVATELLKDIALQLTPAEGQGQDRGFARIAIADLLAEIVRNLVDADVAFIRECRTQDELVLLGGTDAVAWRPGMTPVGSVPLHKHRPDGLCQDLNRVQWASRKSRGTGTGMPASRRALYREDELRFMAWIGSEAWVPIQFGEETFAVVLVASADEDFFTPARMTALASCQVFIQAFFLLAAASDDRADTGVLLRRIIKVLPRLVEAPSLAAFWRAVCAILTCQHGFAFSRAMLFWFHEEGRPAVCEMAVGGLGGASPEWARDNHPRIEGAFGSLRQYIDAAFADPEPATDPAKETYDPLFAAIKKQPLQFSPEDGGEIRKLLDGTNTTEVPRLDHGDPWVRKIQAERADIFNCPHREYFVVPIVPLDGHPAGDGHPTGDGHGRQPFLGFVIVDLAYKPRKHSPGPDNPNLGVVALLLHLIAGIWRARERSESYFQILAALPALRHHGDALDYPVALLARQVDKDDPGTWNLGLIRKQVRVLVPIAEELSTAARIVMEMHAGRQAQGIPRLADWLRGKAAALAQRYPKLACTVEPGRSPAPPARTNTGPESTNIAGATEYNGAVRMASHFLEPILNCLVSNAVEAAAGGALTVVLTASTVDVPESGNGVGKRVVIEVANTGPPIPPAFAPYLFVNRVSTHDRSTTHRGSGLSSARLIAQSHGGDVVLLSAGGGTASQPVKFGIILSPDHQSVAPGGGVP